MIEMIDESNDEFRQTSPTKYLLREVLYLKRYLLIISN